MGKIYRPAILVAGILVFCFLSVSAQNDFLASLNYQTLSINRIANVPGITWVTGNSTYDQNGQRFFIQGNSTQAIPFHLYTTNAVSGAVLYNPVCPAGGVGQIFGLEYDNATDSLYAIFFNANAAYFAWIEPATGIVHTIALLASLTGYTESSFDTKDHLYICHSGTALVVINAANGNIVYNSSFAAGTSVADIVYDNTNGKLYGINSANTLPAPQFDSITLTTAAVHPIANLQPLSLPDINAYTIDEVGGKYIFVGEDPPSSACINNYLYVLDLNTGAILSRTLYPYSQNSQSITDENLVAYSFDNKRGVLYASDWHPPTTNPYINIAASANPICPGDQITFTATPGASVVNPSYQWLLNGVNTGTNSNTYTNSSLQNNDAVYCIITNNDPCAISSTDTSNRVLIQYSPPVAASVSIATPATTVCIGDNVQFTATPVNGGTSPFYQWQVNGIDSGSNTSVFSDDSLHTGDVVSLVMTSVSNCVVTNKTVVSNNLVMQVNSVATAVSIDASATTICAGDTVRFTATPVNGGSSPSYQWQIGGTSAGSNNSVFISDGLANGDRVACIMKGSIMCSLPVASLDTITMIVNPVPTIQLEKQVVITRGKSSTLDPAITGTIVNYQWTPAAGLNNADIQEPLATPIATTAYRLTVTSDKGCMASGTITVIVYTPLNMPNAFVPNGDGRNQVFRIPPSITLNLINFSVYNRWGERIFSTADSGQGWDGSFDGHPQSAAVYVWEIEYYDLLTGKRTMDKGSVMLIR
jgi:gliding motility-associated-like protein